LVRKSWEKEDEEWGKWTSQEFGRTTNVYPEEKSSIVWVTLFIPYPVKVSSKGGRPAFSTMKYGSNLSLYPLMR